MIRAGIDIGAGSLRLVLEKEGLVFDEPCTAAIDKKGNCLAIGTMAQELEPSEEVDIVFPFLEGKLNLQALDILLEELCYEYKLFRPFQKTELLVSYPMALDQESRQLLEQQLTDLGCSDVYFDSEISMAAIGAGLDLFLPVSSCVLYLGFSNCDAAVFSEGQIQARSSNAELNGKTAAALLGDWFREEHNLDVDIQVLEPIIRHMGCVKLQDKPKTAVVEGLDLADHQKRTVVIDENQIASVLAPMVRSLAGWLNSFLESLEPVMKKDVLERGIVACGGLMNLKGLSDLLTSMCSVPVYVADDPANTVARGLQSLIQAM